VPPGHQIQQHDANSLAEELEAACAPSAIAQADPRNPELKQITVQGEHVKVVAKYSVVRGIQKRWVEVMNHTGVKKIQTGKCELM
jgi:translation initiation factor 1 (eIF-1/SUI1)